MNSSRLIGSSPSKDAPVNKVMLIVLTVRKRPTWKAKALKPGVLIKEVLDYEMCPSSSPTALETSFMDGAILTLGFPFTWAINENTCIKDNARSVCEVIAAHQQGGDLLKLLLHLNESNWACLPKV